MATGEFYRTNITTGQTVDNSFIGTVITGADPNLSAGEVFSFTRATGGQITQDFVFQGQASVPDGSGGVIIGFYASRGDSTFLFTSGNPPGGQTVTRIPGDFAVCFLAGTRIATPQGHKAVEQLAIGDLVATPAGQAVPVLWVGRQVLSTLFGLDDSQLPVRIAAGALGPNLPLADLRVTAGHALLIDGVLVNAGALVNGSTIARIPRAALGPHFTVYHVETQDHEIVLAEGAATETFVDNATRSRFDNFAEYVAMFGAEGRPMRERPEPRALSPRQVPPAIRARIAARAAALGAQEAAAA